MNPSSSRESGAAPRYLPALVLLFIGSGCAALIYEIIWYQMLQLVVGLTTVSLGVLLGTFMGGMCLGSLLLPRLVPDRFHPLRVYAALELGIGAIGLGVLTGLPYLARIYTENFGYGPGGMALRIGIAVACLLPPTLLMGATLPAIARWVRADPRGVAWLGFFYGGNIAGAVLGCLLAGFYLLRIYDITIGTYAAVAINVAIAGLAIALSTVTAHHPATSRAKDAGAAPRSPHGRLAMVAIALSGMTALGAEVVWTRQLGLILGGTVYTFAIILAVFLSGLGIGSTAGAYLARDSRRPWLLLGGCQLCLTLAIAWTAFMNAKSLPYWPVDPVLTSGPWFTFQMDMARAIWAMFPAALLWGASFPLALAASAAPGQDPGRLVGGVYAANTLGAILGATLFSMALMPMIGTPKSQMLLIALAGLSALVMFSPLIVPGKIGAVDEGGGEAMGFRLSGAALGLVTLAMTIFLIKGVDRAPWGLVAYGRNFAYYNQWIVKGKIDAADIDRDGPPDNIYMLYEGEGLNGSVVVTETGEGVRSFHAAGKVQASNDPLDMKLQRMLGHISALAIEEPKSVLVIACGAGVTAGTFLLHPTIERIVICDIEELVPTMVAPMFSKENYGIADLAATQNPTIINGKEVLFVYDDGRHFIRTTQEKFDIISSDPIDPWVKGQAALNTIEYYEMCKERLNPGGVMSLWIPLYESNLETTKSVIGTFFTVFDQGILWSNDDYGVGYDAALFGQVGGSHFNIDALQARLLATPAILESLEDVGLGSAMDLLSTFAAYAPDAQAWMADAAINYDNDLRLQYLAGMYFNDASAEGILNDLLRYRKVPESLFSGSPASMADLRRRLGG